MTKVFIIAEAGVNHNGRIDLALRLVDQAVLAGADAVKFQTHTVEDEQLNIEVISPHFDGSDRYSWVKRNTMATPISVYLLFKMFALCPGLFIQSWTSSFSEEKLPKIKFSPATM
jgi:sialic acid synthase SpsE